MNLRRAVSPSTFRTADVRIANFIWAVQAVAVPCEVHTGTAEVAVVASDHEQREPGCRFLDYIQLPIPKNRIGHTIPAASEFLPFAKRQIIENAGGELVVEIDLRKAPIQFLSPGQWPVHGTGKRTYPIRKTRIERSRIGIAQQCIKPVPRVLLGLDLEGVVVSPAVVTVVINGGELAVRSRKISSARTAPQRVTRLRVWPSGAGRRRTDVLVKAVVEDVCAASPSITGGHNYFARQLVLEVDVKLLHHSLLEV